MPAEEFEWVEEGEEESLSAIYCAMDPNTGQFLLGPGTCSRSDLHLQCIRPFDTGEVDDKGLPIFELHSDPTVIIIEVPEGVDPRTHYWQMGEVLPRPRLIKRNSFSLTLGEVMLVEGVPAGTLVTVRSSSIDRLEETVDDGTLEIMSEVPEVLMIRVQPPFPWQINDLVVTVS